MSSLRLVIVTGLSGAGKSQTIRAMEDLDYFCVDNLPPAMLLQFIMMINDDAWQGQRIEKVAICIDVRAGVFFHSVEAMLEELNMQRITYDILFLDATEEVLVRRFRETRRPHPMSPQGRVKEGIRAERSLVEPLRQLSTHIINTSDLSPLQLKAQVRELYAARSDEGGMVVSVVSFGFKYGLLDDADLIFDARFLPNPHWVPELRPLSGKDEVVYAYVMEQPVTAPFMRMLTEMIDFLLPQYIREGKSQLVIGIGCTGGRHRSVAIATCLHQHLSGHYSRLHVEHRDLDAVEQEEKHS